MPQFPLVITKSAASPQSPQATHTHAIYSETATQPVVRRMLINRSVRSRNPSQSHPTTLLLFPTADARIIRISRLTFAAACTRAAQGSAKVRKAKTSGMRPCKICRTLSLFHGIIDTVVQIRRGEGAKEFHLSKRRVRSGRCPLPLSCR